MTPSEFIAQVANFSTLSPNQKIRLFAWYLHTYREVQAFDNAAIRDCFKEAHEVAPDVSVYLPRMAAKRPAELLREKGGYRLEGSIKRALDAKYGEHQTVVTVTKLLSDLPSKVPDTAEKDFLLEALKCYRASAFRASIVMTWNLAFDHLLRWIIADTKRSAEFSASIATAYPKKKLQNLTRLEDFEEFKEAEVIEICRVSKVCTKNVIEILREKLKRRNIAAHPSHVIITQHQADDVITDLVNNVILELR